MVLGEGPKKEISQKWLGEGAKGVLDPGNKGLLALVQKRVAPVQNRVWVVQKTLGRPLLPGSKTPFAPSPNHFWEISIFGPSPRTSGSQLWRGVNKNGVSNFLRSIGHFFFVRSNCWGPVTSENKCVWAPKPCIMRSFGLKVRQKQVREIFRKVCQTCFRAIVAVCRRDF